MCGLAGLVGRGDGDALRRMTDIQRHRGPDDGGTWEKTLPDGRFVGLGSRRLAIRDLSPAGHMPMASDDGRVVLVYNGELYNADVLRPRLEGLGHRFRGHADTEVVLRAVEQWGPAAVDLLEGMFAFAAVDLRDDPPGAPPGEGPTVLLARDAFGVKPLYYVFEGGTLAFASEPKALLQVPGIDARIDPHALHRYLTFLWVPEPDTLFQGIKALPAAHLATFRGGELRIRRFWDVPVPPAGHRFTATWDEALEGVRSRFTDAVRRQRVSDVPIGAFLSAGLDSSAIVAALAEASDEPVRTFTVTFPEEHRVGEATLDDPAVARRVAAAFGCRHEEIVAEPDVVDLLPRLVWHLDVPLGDPAVIAAYLVCRAARPSVTVLLSGVGGDELFAGYRKHAAWRIAQRWQRLPSPLRRAAEAGAARIPSFRGTPLMGPAVMARKMARSASLPPDRGYLANGTWLDDGEKRALYAPALRERLADADAYRMHQVMFATVADADPVNRMLYVDLRAFMPSLNLAYNDRASMATSLEVRVPFLDRELTRYAFQEVPPAWKVTDALRPVTKHVFREAMRGTLPEEVLRQPKAGFGGPHDRWLSTDLREMVDDLLSPDQIRRRGLFDPHAVRALVEGHRRGRRDAAYPLWALLTLELWQRAFLDGDVPAPAPAPPPSELRTAGAVPSIETTENP